MKEQSPLQKIRQLEITIQTILRQQPAQDGDKSYQRLIAELKRELTDARLDVRDAEYADSGEQYRRYVIQARERLAKVIQLILALSQHDLFTPIEVAEISAQLEQAGSEL